MIDATQHITNILYLYRQTQEGYFRTDGSTNKRRGTRMLRFVLNTLDGGWEANQEWKRGTASAATPNSALYGVRFIYMNQFSGYFPRTT